MRRPVVVYGLTFAAVAAAGVIRGWFDPLLDDHLPLVTFVLAVAVASWLGGFRAALLATVLGFVIGLYFFVRPRYSFEIATASARPYGVALYFIVCLTLIALGEAMRATQRRGARRSRLLEATLAGIRDGIVTTDAAGRVTFVNGLAAEWTGWTPEAAARQRLAEVFRVTDSHSGRPGNFPVEDVLLRGKPIAVPADAVLVARGGTKRWIEGGAAPVWSEAGRVDGLVLAFRDVTDRKRAAEALAETAQSLTRERERLALALHTGGLGVYEWRAGETFIWWAPEMYRLFGVQPGSFAPTVDNLSALIHPEDRDRFWRKTQESMARREVFAQEYRIVRPGGAVRWIFNCSHVGLDADGRMVRITGVAADITDRKVGEEEIHRLNRELNERMAELADADRRKDLFLATLAHELRNPLAPIRSAAQVLKAKGSADPDLAWSRDVIDRQVGQMARLLEDLLDVSRITRGKLELRKERVRLSAVIETAVETSRPLIAAGGHELSVSLPAEPVSVDADPVRLAQVFSNLLNNAAKYTDRGGIIRLTAERTGDEVVVSVADNGIGISADLLLPLFEMFTQATPALERSQGGLGIGLSLVKGLVEMHGGSVSAHSEGPGRGSEFVIRLPVAEAATVEEEPPVEVERGSTARHRIVVADDNRDAAESLAMMLQFQGHEVTTANDGQQAVEVAEAFRPDVMLLDIGMPRLNGYEVAHRIHQQPWGREVLLVAVSGWGQDEDRRRAEEAGFDYHFTKPVDPAELLELLAEVHSPAP